jgi:uncharacterized C2H2 Zn-finger protein
MEDKEKLYRLCHVCGFVNEAEKEILRCGRCAKTFQASTSLEQVLRSAGVHLNPVGPNTETMRLMSYFSIQGLTAYF